MKKRFLAVLLAFCLMCALCTSAYASGKTEKSSTASKIVTYNLNTGARTEKTVTPSISPFALDISVPAMAGSGDFTDLIANGTLEVKELDALNESGIMPFAYDKNWQRVSTPSSFPYRAIAYLKIYFPEGLQTGTGFMLASGKIVTAAHCLYNLHSGHEGETPNKIEVYFGWNNGSSYKSAVVAKASAFHVNDMWDSYLDADYDYGVIDIESSVTSATGRFGYTTSVDSSTTYTLTGIPYDNKAYYGYYMYTDSGTIDDWDSYTIQHSLNCTGGVSGAPLYNPSNQVVGLHTWSNSSYGTATRITSDLVSMLS